MTLVETIQKRKSIRSYVGEALRMEERNSIIQYINELPQPLGGDARIELISSDTGDQPVKLGTYGVISRERFFGVAL